uniref:Zona pellucida sperm-binding protein 3 n=1 Tax=Anas platyrhynchos TaxID=8839 RepID=A0A8B9SH55_ANAPL
NGGSPGPSAVYPQFIPCPIPVQVRCGSGRLSVGVPAGLLGAGAFRELRLGSGCGVTGADGDRYWLEHPLTACGTVLQLLPDTIRYTNLLRYRPLAAGPAARPAPFSVPVECRYPRRGSISSGAVQPTWIPFGSTVAHRRRLRFALDAYDRSWTSRLPLPTFVLGELINIQASVAAETHLPLRVFVDECVASPGTASPVSYQLIGDGGCLLDGRLGRSRFLPQRRDGALRFQLDSFLFPNTSSPQIFLRCHLRAAVAGAGGSKACSYDPSADCWVQPASACGCSWHRLAHPRHRSLAQPRPAAPRPRCCAGTRGTQVSAGSPPWGVGFPSAPPHLLACPRRASAPRSCHHAGDGGHGLRPRRRGRAGLLLLRAALPQPAPGGGTRGAPCRGHGPYGC